MALQMRIFLSLGVLLMAFGAVAQELEPVRSSSIRGIICSHIGSKSLQLNGEKLRDAVSRCVDSSNKGLNVVGDPKVDPRFRFSNGGRSYPVAVQLEVQVDYNDARLKSHVIANMKLNKVFKLREDSTIFWTWRVSSYVVSNLDAPEKTQKESFNDFLGDYPELDEVAKYPGVKKVSYSELSLGNKDLWDVFPNYFDPAEMPDTECNQNRKDDFYALETSDGKLLPVAMYLYRECGSTEWDEINYSPSEQVFVVEEL